jgi:hypothetical protein
MPARAAISGTLISHVADRRTACATTLSAARSASENRAATCGGIAPLETVRRRRCTAGALRER